MRFGKASRTARRLSPLGAIVGFVATLALVPAPAPAQSEGPASSTPRTPWGAPDLQGIWDFRTITPLERPADLADKARLSEEEAASYEAAENRRQNRDLVDPEKGGAIYPAESQGGVVPYNEFWYDRGDTVVADRRTSLIVDPPDGRLPPLQSGVREQIGAAGEDLPGARPVLYRAGGIGADGPEDRGLGERCILGFNSGPPMIPAAYNNNIQVFQTRDHVVILNEMVHDARVVPLDGRPHLTPAVRLWMGDGRGRWEGDTLVVETRNFSARTPSFNPSITSAVGSGETLRLTERFTRVDTDTLRYEYTVDDPATFTRPFSAAIPMRRSDLPLFEYACHEGNRGLNNILAGVHGRGRWSGGRRTTRGGDGVAARPAARVHALRAWRPRSSGRWALRLDKAASCPARC